MRHDDKCPERAYVNWEECVICSVIDTVRFDEREATLVAVCDVIDAAEAELLNPFSRNALKSVMLYIGRRGMPLPLPPSVGVPERRWFR